MGRKLPRRDSAENEHVSSAGDEDTQVENGKAPMPEDGTQQHKHKKYKQNWRLSMLSVPKVVTEKYVEAPWLFSSGVPKDALNAECTERTEHLALRGIRHLKVNKVLYTPLRGPPYGKRMDDYIEKSWNSIYNYYRKSLYDLKKRKAEQHKFTHRWNALAMEKKGKKGKGKDKASAKIGKKDSKNSERSKETIIKERETWCFERSKPKALIPPTPIDRGPIVDLDIIKQRQDELSLPKRLYRTPSQESNYKDPTKVSPGALAYEATERIVSIAQAPQHRLLKSDELVPGAVKPAALKYIISERMTQLAIPKPTTMARESDLNEDAFTISPAALKYIATPRILEIAKPKEYAF